MYPLEIFHVKLVDTLVANVIHTEYKSRQVWSQCKLTKLLSKSLDGVS